MQDTIACALARFARELINRITCCATKTSSFIICKQLFTNWMLAKGYFMLVKYCLYKEFAVELQVYSLEQYCGY